MAAAPLKPLPKRCPVCSNPLYIERLRCAECETAVEGRFTSGWPEKLSAEQLAFVHVFLASRGKIKDVEQVLGLSYPTVVSRLDDVVAAIGPPVAPAAAASASATTARPAHSDVRRKILDDLAAGLIDADEALRRLKKARGSHP